MGRKAIYSSAAERTRAYRARLEQQAAELGTTAAPAPPAKPPKKKAAPKPLSRPKRLEAVLDEVKALLESLQSWRDGLPENLQSSALADKLEAAIDGFTNAADTLGSIDMPMGFGRD